MLLTIAKLPDIENVIDEWRWVNVKDTL